jgi:hypothetical protein
MVKKDYDSRKLTASQGHMLTQNADVEEWQRVLAPYVILGAGDNAANWKEITQEEADAVLARQKEAARYGENS